MEQGNCTSLKVDIDDSALPVDSSLHSYQLTHHFLISSLRTWLIRKQSETIYGRAQLRLEDQVAKWGSRNDSRLLPTLPEYIEIQLFTNRFRWTPQQRQMMTRATLWHGIRWLRICILVLMVGFSIQYARTITLNRDLQSAIESIQNNPPLEFYRALDELKELPRETALKELLLRQKMTDGVDRLRIDFGLAELGVVDPIDLCSKIETTPPEEADNLISSLNCARDACLKEIRTTASKHRDAKNWLREGRFALVALYLGEIQIASDMCRIDERPDPIQRTCFIEAMILWPGDVAKLAAFARDTEDRALRSAICLGLSEIDRKSISSAARMNWIPLLAEWIKSTSDGLTRSAAELAISNWGIEVPTGQPTATGSSWKVNSIGMVLNRIPPNERAATAATTEFHIPQSPFWMSDREVSISQFQKFLTAPNYPESEKLKEPVTFTRSDPTFPAHAVNWYDAVLYCNWLSRKENLTPYYERTEATDGSGNYLWRSIPTASGYRLPDEAQWELACRAGTTTEYSCGDGFLLTRFANIVGSELNPCALRFPNNWGLFDMHGNVAEWCDARIFEVDDQGVENQTQIIRGGSWTTPVANAASSFRRQQDPASRLDDVGFRVVLPEQTGW